VKLTLSSGQWLELRGPDELNAGDRLAMHATTQLPVSPGQNNGSRTYLFSLGDVDEQLYAVLGRIIQAWSYPFCIPRDDDSYDEHGRPTFENSLKRLPLDDWDEIEEATAPHMAKLRGGKKELRTTSTSSVSTSPAAEEVSPTG
jgi:hypothetical protein